MLVRKTLNVEMINPQRAYNQTIKPIKGNITDRCSYSKDAFFLLSQSWSGDPGDPMWPYWVLCRWATWPMHNGMGSCVWLTGQPICQQMRDEEPRMLVSETRIRNANISDEILLFVLNYIVWTETFYKSAVTKKSSSNHVCHCRQHIAC